MADIEQGQRQAQEEEVRRTRRLLLYKAAKDGDWETAKRILTEFPEEKEAKLSKQGETILHIAVVARKTDFLSRLVKLLSENDLAVRNGSETKSGNTAFWYAARYGYLEAVEIMMAKNPDVVMMRSDIEERLPICTAAHYGHHTVVRYLYPATENQMNEEEDLLDLLINLVHADIYDVALKVVKAHPLLVTKKDVRTGNSVFYAFARKTSITSIASLTSDNFNQYKKIHTNSIESFTMLLRDEFDFGPTLDLEQESKLRDIIWEKATQLDDVQISELLTGKSGRAAFIAAEQGNDEFLRLLSSSHPDVLLEENEKGQTIFHIAVLNRFHNIFKLIHDSGSFNDFISGHVDKEGNNILHLAAYLPSSNRLNVISGAFLQLQYELLWFEEVMKVMSPEQIDAKNKMGLTPKHIFLEQHQELTKEEDIWIRSTANSSMVVATLVATVAFAAAFTLPGGDGQDNGIPIFLKQAAFKVFALSDAISFIFSVSTVLSFLSILSSRYSIEDFRSSLPRQLQLGVSLLFISVLTMMIAFVAAFFIIFKHGQLRFAYPVAFIASIPIFLFIWQHTLLLYQVIRSTYIITLLLGQYDNDGFQIFGREVAIMSSISGSFVRLLSKALKKKLEL